MTRTALAGAGRAGGLPAGPARERLYTGALVALNRDTGAIVYEHQLPTSANAPIAMAGNTILVPAGGPSLYGPKGGSPQLVAYTVP